MAQAKVECLEQPDGCVGEKDLNDKQGSSTMLECAVCLQSCDMPVKLPCSHIFCYLCIKGVAHQSNKCPMCRQDIPTDFVERPELVEIDDGKSHGSEEEHQWFYEGRNGWWQYDQRTSIELETAYKQGRRTCELLIAGNLYIADFGSMEQFRRNEPRRHRRIKRDLSNVPKKGVAGIRLNPQDSDEPVIIREIRGAERATSPVSDSMGTDDGTNTPVPPSNTPQTPGGQISGDATPLSDRTDQRSDSLHQVLEQMSSLTLMRGGRFSLNNDNDDEETNNESSFSDNHHSVRWLNSSDSDSTFLPDEDNP